MGLSMFTDDNSGRAATNDRDVRAVEYGRPMCFVLIPQIIDVENGGRETYAKRG